MLNHAEYTALGRQHELQVDNTVSGIDDLPALKDLDRELWESIICGWSVWSVWGAQRMAAPELHLVTVWVQKPTFPLLNNFYGPCAECCRKSPLGPYARDKLVFCFVVFPGRGRRSVVGDITHYTPGTGHWPPLDGLDMSGQVSSWSVWSVWYSSCCRMGAVWPAWSRICFLRHRG